MTLVFQNQVALRNITKPLVLTWIVIVELELLENRATGAQKT